jgi:hypothetical protein
MRKVFVVLGVAAILSLQVSTALATSVDYPSVVATPPVIEIQTAATTGNGIEVDTDHKLDAIVFEIVPSAGISAGKVVVECAHACGYTGTWSALTSEYTLVASTAKHIVASGPVGCVRARISTDVEGGTVTIYFAGIRTGAR